MLPKIKRFIKKNKKIVTLGIAFIVILIVLIILFKVLFYSSSEKSVYGVRLKNIKENEFTKEEKKEFKEKSSNIEGIKNVKVVIKGRLIKAFVTFDDSLSSDDIKNKFNEMTNYVSEKVKGYYDITFYAIQNKDGKETYPVIGYKHKNKSSMSYEVL